LLQLRETLGYEERYRYPIHDRDSIFAKSLDESIKRVLPAPHSTVTEGTGRRARRSCSGELPGVV
jgi:hypothetical protein